MRTRAVALAVLLCGHTLTVAQDVSPFEGRLRALFVGRNISVAVKRLGATYDRQMVDADVVYFWGMWGDSTVKAGSPDANKDRSFSCEVRLFTDAHTGLVKREAVEDRNNGCHFLFGPKLN